MMAEDQGGGEGGGAGAAAIANAGGEGGGQGGGEAQASWRDSLPEAMRGDESLANFADVGALAKGYLDTKAAATARAPDFTSEAGLKQFADAVRPADAAAYEITVPEGQPTDLADKFRAFAHEMGMPPAWAKAVAEFNNQSVAAAIAAEEAASQADVDTLKKTMGADKFDAGLAAVRAMLEAAPVKLAPEDLAKLDAKIGSSNLLSWMMDMAARVGDPAPIENPGGGAGLGAMTPAQAKERWNVAQKDATWRAQAKIDGTPENKEYQRLNRLIAQGKAAKPQQNT